MTGRLVIAAVVLAAPALARGQTAEQSYQDGQAAYDRQDYAAAIQHWETALGLVTDPRVQGGIRFNLGQAYRLSGDCTRALASYRELLRLDPASPKTTLSRGFIAELEPKCGAPPARATSDAPPPAPAPTPVAPTDSAPGGRGKRITGLAAIGGGVLLLGTGVYFGRRADALGDDATVACAAGCAWPEVERIDADGRRAERLQWVFGGIGTAAVIGGVVLYYLGARDAADRSSIAVAPAGDGAVAAWGGTW